MLRRVNRIPYYAWASGVSKYEAPRSWGRSPVSPQHQATPTAEITSLGKWSRTTPRAGGVEMIAGGQPSMWLWRFTSYVTMDSQDVFLFLAVDQLAVETLAVFFF